MLNFSLTESVLQMSSAIFTVRHLNHSQYATDQEDVFFVTYNSFNDFLLSLFKSATYFEQDLAERASQKNTFIMILFLSSIGTILLSVPILVPAVSSVNKTKEKVLGLFVEIPNHYTNDLSASCENFINSLHDDQQDELASEDDPNAQHNSNSDKNVAKRTIHKQAKNSSKSNRNFFIQFCVAVMVVMAYFITMFALAKQYIGNILIVQSEMSTAAYNEAVHIFIQNVQREMLYDPTRKVLNNDSFVVS